MQMKPVIIYDLTPETQVYQTKHQVNKPTTTKKSKEKEKTNQLKNEEKRKHIIFVELKISTIVGHP